MQGVGAWHRLMGIEVKPTLATRFFGACVPCPGSA